VNTPGRSTARASVLQWPTFALLIGCYLAIAALTYLGKVTAVWHCVPLLALCLALHSSLQHELLHGNPCTQQWLNDLWGFPAVGIFIPYLRFKATHLAHHRDEYLTDPHDDPESNYLHPDAWESHSVWMQAVYRFNNTLMGRMLVGHLIGLSQFYTQDIRAMLHGDSDIVKAYALHLLGVVLSALWIIGVAQWPLVAWVVAAYGALSILRIRTYLEHRASDEVTHRTAIVNDRGPLAWLFLNNNFHAVHHTHPRLPWYELPNYYDRNKDFFDKLCDYYTYPSYLSVFLLYFWRQKDPVPHPLRGDAQK